MAPKTLVVPLDGSKYAEQALPIAETLADRIGGRLLLVSAQYYGPLEPREYLDEVATRYQRCPLDVIATKDSFAAKVIADALDESDDRVVCMTTHGRGRLRWAAVGSVAEDVIRQSSRPLFLVGRNCRKDFLTRSSHLLACADGGEGAEELAPAVQEWSELLGLDLRVAVVVHPLDIESAEHTDALLGPIAAQFGEASRGHTSMLRSRWPAGALADLSDELPAAVIGMNCHGRSGLARFALGSVTMSVLHMAPCPLLVTHRAPAAAADDEGSPR